MLGAIHRRKWECTGRESDLGVSAAYYLRNFEQGAEHDAGSTGINAAFVLGLLNNVAEFDLLRGVEFLSCVSGGSIAAAHYYLEAQNLLAAKEDADIAARDYVDIVIRVKDDFLVGVQRNIRTRLATEWLTNIKMMFAADYSRTITAPGGRNSENIC